MGYSTAARGLRGKQTAELSYGSAQYYQPAATWPRDRQEARPGIMAGRVDVYRLPCIALAFGNGQNWRLPAFCRMNDVYDLNPPSLIYVCIKLRAS